MRILTPKKSQNELSHQYWCFIGILKQMFANFLDPAAHFTNLDLFLMQCLILFSKFPECTARQVRKIERFN